jgi:hypothetical protein
MFYRQSLFNTIFHPKSLFRPLATGAMPVSAAVVAGVFFSTGVAAVLMASQCRCPALFQGIQGTQLISIGMMLLNKPAAKTSDDLCYVRWHRASL